MQNTYHIVIKKEYASAVIEDLQKMKAVEVLPDTAFEIPQWQKEEIRKRKKYNKQHPDELIDWKDAQKMIKTD
jgi:hypothetical protein